MPELGTFPAADHNWYKLQRVYNYVSGLVQQPVAGAIDGTQECAFVRIHSPMESMTIFFAAESEGMAPTIPDPYSLLTEGGGPNGDNLIFLGFGQGADAPVCRLSGQGHFWQASATYHYGLKKPRAKGSSIKTGRIPGDSTIAPWYTDYPVVGGFEQALVLDTRQ